VAICQICIRRFRFQFIFFFSAPRHHWEGASNSQFWLFLLFALFERFSETAETAETAQKRGENSAHRISDSIQTRNTLRAAFGFLLCT
jgi:hypothetical protein